MQLPTFSFEQILTLFIINQVASALVQSLPTPVEGGNVVYASVYKFLSIIIGDFKAFMTKVPAPPVFATPTTPTTDAAQL